ncbi:MAG: NHL repeat-containing protein [Candidatus Aminicenantes bacterium]|nr:NHL repeat-containing protein [Candidatus Aminicenantes bacterium]
MIRRKGYFAAATVVLCVLYGAPLALESELPGDAAGQKIEIENGVRVVHNTKGGQWGSDPKVSIELVRTIGDVDTDDENLAFNAPLDIAVDEVGSIYVLDSGNQRIQVFGLDGRFARTIGRRGQGPGEFAGPNSIDIDGEGRLHVLDNPQKRIQIFSTNGQVIKTILTSKHRIDRMRLLGSGAYVTRSHAIFGMAGAPKEKVRPKLVKLLGPDLEVRREFGEPFDYGDEITNTAGNSWEFAVDDEDHLYLCFLYQNRIEKYSPEGQLLWRADRELNFPTKLLERGEQKVTPTSATYIAPKFNRVAVGIAADDKGRAWVVTCERQIRKEEVVTIMTSGSPSGMTRKIVGNTDLRTTDMFKLELFGPDGVLLGEIPLTHFVDLIHIHKDRLFLLDRDRGVKFYEYKIIEN